MHILCLSELQILSTPYIKQMTMYIVYTRNIVAKTVYPSIPKVAEYISSLITSNTYEISALAYTKSWFFPENGISHDHTNILYANQYVST